MSSRGAPLRSLLWAHRHDWSECLRRFRASAVKADAAGRGTWVAAAAEPGPKPRDNRRVEHHPPAARILPSVPPQAANSAGFRGPSAHQTAKRPGEGGRGVFGPIPTPEETGPDAGRLTTEGSQSFPPGLPIEAPSLHGQPETSEHHSFEPHKPVDADGVLDAGHRATEGSHSPPPGLPTEAPSLNGPPEPRKHLSSEPHEPPEAEGEPGVGHRPPGCRKPAELPSADYAAVAYACQKAGQWMTCWSLYGEYLAARGCRYRAIRAGIDEVAARGAAGLERARREGMRSFLREHDAASENQLATTVLKALNDARRTEDAFRIATDLPHLHPPFTPDEHTTAQVLTTKGRAGFVQESVDQLRETVTANPALLSSVMHNCATAGRHELAISLFRRWIRDGKPLNPRAATIALTSFAEASAVMQAYHFLLAASRSPGRPDHDGHAGPSPLATSHTAAQNEFSPSPDEGTEDSSGRPRSSGEEVVDRSVRLGRASSQANGGEAAEPAARERSFRDDEAFFEDPDGEGKTPAAAEARRSAEKEARTGHSIQGNEAFEDPQDASKTMPYPSDEDDAETTEQHVCQKDKGGAETAEEVTRQKGKATVPTARRPAEEAEHPSQGSQFFDDPQRDEGKTTPSQSDEGGAETAGRTRQEGTPASPTARRPTENHPPEPRPEPSRPRANQARGGPADEAADALPEGVAFGLLPDTHAFNSVMAALANRGLAEPCLVLFDAMEAAGIERNPATFGTLFKAHGKGRMTPPALLRFVELAEATGHLLTHPSQPPITDVYHSAFSAFKPDDAPSALRFYNRVEAIGHQQTAAMHTSIVQILVAGENLPLAVQLIRRIRSLGVQLDPQAVVVLTDALIKAGLPDLAEQLAASSAPETGVGAAQDPFLAAQTIKRLGAAGRPGEALRVYQELAAAQPGDVTPPLCLVAAAAASRNGRKRDAVALLVGASIAHSTRTVAALLSVVASAQADEPAVSAEAWRAVRTVLSRVTWSGSAGFLVALCGNAGIPQTGIEVHNMLEALGYDPTADSILAVLRCLQATGHWQQAFAVVRYSCFSKTNARLGEAAIRCCYEAYITCRTQQETLAIVQAAVRFAEDVWELGGLNAEAGREVVRLCMDVGQLDWALHVFRSMDWDSVELGHLVTESVMKACVEEEAWAAAVEVFESTKIKSADLHLFLADCPPAYVRPVSFVDDSEAYSQHLLAAIMRNSVHRRAGTYSTGHFLRDRNRDDFL
ncbi:hypothetical protein DIPPA_21344 [Diplonema papillatum]|nr:hypothetical protein DIPPA_21344 [Diplonema papillatum]